MCSLTFEEVSLLRTAANVPAVVSGLVGKNDVQYANTILLMVHCNKNLQLYHCTKSQHEHCVEHQLVDKASCNIIEKF